MGALKPKNDKYRRLWKIYGKNMNPSKTYCDNFDKIKWGNGTKEMKRVDLNLDNHYVMTFGDTG